MDSGHTRTLVLAATRGEDGALEELVASFSPRLLAYVRLHMGPELRAREGSMDIAQSVCREVLVNIQREFEYRDQSSFLSWLFTAALNKIRDRHRYQRRQKRAAVREVPELLADATAGYATLISPSRDAIGREDVERLERAFDRLPPNYREVITLARVVGMRHAEIAEQMGRTPAAVQVMLGRALARLTQIYEQPPDSNGD